MSKFIYTIEKLNNNGHIWIYKNDEDCEKSEQGIMLSFTNEQDLLNALTDLKKSGIWIVEDDSELIEEGKRLSKLLGIQLIAPFFN